jgi:hypothetical protein
MVVLAPTARPAIAIDDEVYGAGGWIIGVDYSEPSWDDDGYLLIRLHNHGGCTATVYGDTDSAAAALPTGWNDQISSFENFGGGEPGYYECMSMHYWDTNFNGSTFGYYTRLLTMPGFDNKSSSITWS